MPHKKRDFKTRLTFHLLLFSLIVFITGGVILGLGRNIKTTATGIASIKQGFTTRSQQLSDLARLREEAKLADEKLPILRSVLPQKDKLFLFPQEIESLAIEKGVTTNFTFSKEVQGSADFTLAIGGELGAIIKFIKYIEETMPFISFTDFDLTQTTDGYRTVLRGTLFFNE
jgi:Tfp pilus assembly protein PilO